MKWPEDNICWLCICLWQFWHLNISSKLFLAVQRFCLNFLVCVEAHPSFCQIQKLAFELQDSVRWETLWVKITCYSFTFNLGLWLRQWCYSLHSSYLMLLEQPVSLRDIKGRWGLDLFLFFFLCSSVLVPKLDNWKYDPLEQKAIRITRA